MISGKFATTKMIAIIDAVKKIVHQLINSFDYCIYSSLKKCIRSSGLGLGPKTRNIS